jgi:hypothetical protein
MDEDDGPQIGYKLVPRGTPVYTADGTQVGTVYRVQDNVREHIFDGIVIDTPNGRRFVDAPEVRRIGERGVRLTITASEAETLPEHRGLRGTLETRAKRSGQRWRRRFGR